MLCSISSATKSGGSNWLDRLRSNKGFPAGDSLGLDHFLTNNYSDPNTSLSPIIPTNAPDSAAPTPELTHSVSDPNIPPNRTDISTQDTHKPKDGEWVGVMSNVLSELFIMGGPNRTSTFKKSSRKQTNPKFCVVSTPPSGSDDLRDDENAQPATASLNSDNNRASETKNTTRDGNVGECEVDVEEEKEKGEKELLGYSRSEVTVIDTSCAVWKSDKLVYRRKNVWKVRDKKGKSRVFGRKKKRKDNVMPDDSVGRSKKAKMSTPELESHPRKADEGMEFFSPSNHLRLRVANPHKGREEVTERTRTDLSQVAKRRLPRKSREEGSSVMLANGIGTSKTDGQKLSRSSSMYNERQQKT